MPGSPTIDDDAIEVAVRAVVRLSRAVENVLGVEQISVSQFRILGRLVDGSARGRNLAEWLAVKPPSVTTLVDALVRRGLVERTVDESDRRQVTHTLTPAGASLHRELSARVGARLWEIAHHHVDQARTRAMIESLAEWDVALDAARSAKRADKPTAIT